MALCNDFARIHDTRPGYGYAGIQDPNRDVLAPKNSGIWRMNLATGKRELIFSIADGDALNDGISRRVNVKQRFEHLLFGPDAKRFCFLHRWTGARGGDSFDTRLITVDLDGSDAYSLDPYGQTSHFTGAIRNTSWHGHGTPAPATSSTSIPTTLGRLTWWEQA